MKPLTKYFAPFGMERMRMDLSEVPVYYATEVDARIAELEADAERYRWLTDCAFGPVYAPTEDLSMFSVRVNCAGNHKDIHSAIDAARKGGES